jgi:hypothetical protein
MLTVEQTRSVERNLNQIAMESGVLSNMVNSIKNIFPDLINTLRNSFSQTENLPKIEITLTADQKFLIKEISQFKYIDIAELSTQVPEGFIGNYIDYSKELIRVIDDLSDVNGKVLQPYSIYLSTFLTNKDAKYNTKDQTRLYNNMKNVREQHIKAIGHFFKDSSSTSKVKIGQVVKRNSDFQTVYNETGIIAKKIYSINLKTLNENVKRCLDMLDMIIEKIQKGEIEHVSPEVTQNLAFGAYEVARELEFFSVVYFKVLSLSTSVDATTIKVNNFIKNIPD